jgi:hypothetical protein
MVCKKCDCEYKLHIQKIEHQNEMERLCSMFVRLRRDMAWLEYKLTGDIKSIDKLEYEVRNGAF